MKIVKNSFVLGICILLTLISACEKPEGKGGNSSIKGVIWVKKLNLSGTAVIGEYAGAYQDVYIIYGDDLVDGEKIQANPDGVYEFKYLQPGKYKIYAYTQDSTFVSTSKKIPITKDIEITKKKQTVDAGTIQIFTNKN